MFKVDTASVFSSTSLFIQSHVDNAMQRSFILTALNHLQTKASQEPHVSFIHIPYLVASAICNNISPASPLTITTTILFLGFDIIDDLADGDNQAFWTDYPHEQIRLAAMLLLCSLPQLSIANFTIPPKQKNALYKVLAQSLLQMASGQQTDLALTKKNRATVDEVEKSVIKKSGEELALFATLAAHYAGSTKKEAKAYATFARFLGTAAQFTTDCHDLFETQQSRDLTHGTRTLPIAFHLERNSDDEHEILIQMLAKAENDAAIHDAVRKKLKATGALRRSALVIELYCKRALNALDKAHPKEPAKGLLQHIIRSASLFSQKNGKEATDPYYDLIAAAINKGGKNELRKYRKTGRSLVRRCNLPPKSKEGSRRNNPPVQDHTN